VASHAVSPSGQQVKLRHGAHRAVVVEVGGGLREYDVDGVTVLDGYPVDQMVTAARGQLLIPWPNRLHEGKYTWDGAEHVAPIDEPAGQNAIHGLTRWRNWTPAERTESSVTMRLDLRPQPAYPFSLELSARHELSDDGLRVTMSATNVGDLDAPYGCGAHPYVTVGTDRIDEATLTVPANSWLPTGPAGIPREREKVEGSAVDFREPRRIGSDHLDYAFTNLQRDSDGWVRLRVTGPDRGVELWLDEAFGYLEVFTGDTVPEEERRRRSIAVEPMTCPPNAFVRGEGVVRLRPGDTHTATWAIHPLT
jgi:aldose 1-epimerase